MDWGHLLLMGYTLVSIVTLAAVAAGHRYECAR
jgi:hypothetical protein